MAQNETSRARRARQSALARTFANGFGTLSRVGRRVPFAHPRRHGVELLPDIPYRAGGRLEHRLDVYRPLVPAEGPAPAVIYFHGGGFRALSKESHWLMGLAFARRGYVVFNVAYRLAPENPYPAAWQDIATAWAWVLDHAALYGADPSRVVVAGESAGANLAAALAVMTCYPRPEDFAQPVWERGVVPRAVLPACGLFQVSDTARFARRRRLSMPIRDVIEDISETVLPVGPGAPDGRLADPLCIIEDEAPTRPLPPFFLPVGTSDPLLDDTRRMAAALEQRGAHVEARYYPGEVHAFHALVWRRQARQCWQEMLAFTELQLRDSSSA
jgi:acetyl esterase